MILKISTTHQPAADLGYLLHKNPTRLHEETFPFGKGYVLFPEISEEMAQAALLLDVDGVASTNLRLCRKQGVVDIRILFMG